MILTFSLFIHSHPRPMLIMRVLQLCFSIAIGVALTVAFMMHWDINDISTNLAGKFSPVLLSSILFISKSLSNITFSYSNYHHILPYFSQFCVNGIPISDDTSTNPPQSCYQTIGQYYSSFFGNCATYSLVFFGNTFPEEVWTLWLWAHKARYCSNSNMEHRIIFLDCHNVRLYS